jgi:hypothetical protein
VAECDLNCFETDRVVACQWLLDNPELAALLGRQALLDRSELYNPDLVATQKVQAYKAAIELPEQEFSLIDEASIQFEQRNSSPLGQNAEPLRKVIFGFRIT